MSNFKKNTNVISLMDKIMLVLDGEPNQDCANALQYVLNLVHTGPNQTPPDNTYIPQVAR